MKAWIWGLLCRYHGERAIEDGQANNLRSGDMRAVGFALWGIKHRAGTIGLPTFLPFAFQNVGSLIRIRMDVGGDDCSFFKLAQHCDAAGGVIFVQDL